jgi:hypothetical protein
MPGSTPVNVKNGQANEKWQTNDGYDPRKIASDAAQGGGGAGGGGGGGERGQGVVLRRGHVDRKLVVAG